MIFIKNLIRPTMIWPTHFKDDTKIRNKNVEFGKKIFFGTKNKKKIFYVIKKNYAPNGFFSLVTFVLEHLNYALNKSYIPIVDMENFINPYNENTITKKTYNSWEYYFKNLSNYNLKDVYQSKNVIFSSNNRFTSNNLTQSKIFLRLFKKYIKIDKNIISEVKKIKKNLIKNKDKVLGVRLSGLLQRVVTNHEFPVNNNDALNITKKIFFSENCNKVFLITEDLDQLKIFKKYFKNKLIYLDVPRSKCKFYGSHNLEYENYVRAKHRYLLGKECLIHSMLLSEFDVLLYRTSNIVSFSSLLNKKRQKKFEVVTEKNSKNVLFARWKWYLKNYFPIFFGKLNYKIIRRD